MNIRLLTVVTLALAVSGATAQPTRATSATISGTVFNDLTDNGFSADDVPLQGISVVLLTYPAETGLATDITGNAGTYSFSVTDGKYLVEVLVPSNYILTGGGPDFGGVYLFEVDRPVNLTGANFDLFQTGSTPEPGTCGLTLIGLGLLRLMRKRKAQGLQQAAGVRRVC
jgi:SdrD B-like domain